MSTSIGPISSPNGVRDCYLDISPHLEAKEELTGTPVVTSDNADVVVSNVNILQSSFRDPNGNFVPGKRAVMFRLTTNAALTSTIKVTVSWSTTSGESDSQEVDVDIVPKLTAVQG
jgi:hypothetical protein